jgi:hypothetical protein
MAAILSATTILASGCSEAEREQIKAEKDEAFTESKVESAQSRQDKANEHFERAASKLQ